MIRFKEFLKEATGDSAKKFEEDLVNVLNYSIQNKVSFEKATENVIIQNSGGSSVVVNTLKKVNINPTGAIHSTDYKPYSSLSPNYGVAQNQPKADILIFSGNKWFPISVKLSGSIVLASTQNKKEFEGMFNSALQMYEEREGGQVSKITKNLINKIKNEAIEEVFEREKLTDKGIESFIRRVDVASKTVGKEEKKKIFTDLMNFVNEARGRSYESASKEISNFGKELENILKGNKLLKQYITWEAMTSYAKFNSGTPITKNSEFDNDKKPSRAYASYILSPNEFSSIKSPKSSFIKAASATSKINFRGLPVGVPRGSKSQGVKLAQSFLKGDKSLQGVFNELNKMAINFKFDADSKKIEKEIERLKENFINSNDIILNEGFFSLIKRTLKFLWNLLKERVLRMKKFFKKFLDILLEKRADELVELFNITMTIK